MRVFLGIIAAVLVAAPASGSPDKESLVAMADASRRQQSEVLSKTEALLLGKRDAKQALLRVRLRALYKLSRAADRQLWTNPDERHHQSRWRGAAVRILERNRSELALLEDELEVIAEAKNFLSRGPETKKLEQLPALMPPLDEMRTLKHPGEYRHEGVNLTRRGREYKARGGQTVVAPCAGDVVYTGLIAGLGPSLVLECGTVYVLLAGLQSRVEGGIDAGEELGRAIGGALYVEVRLRDGAAGSPVDPRDMGL